MKLKIFVNALVGCSAAFVLGIFFSVCWLFTNDEIFENTAAFWAAIF